MKAWQKAAIGISGAVVAVLGAGFLTSMAAQRRIMQGEPTYELGGPLVSVVIPALGEEDYLPGLLQSIENQTYRSIEVIVADSSSSPSKEKTEEICREYGARYVFVPKLNVAHARNEGARAASGEILCFVDADCVMSPEYIEKMVEALTEDETVLAHGGDPTIEDSLFQTITIIGRSWLKPVWQTSGRGICIWKDAFWEIGGYDESLDPTLGYREDIDLGKRVQEYFGPGSIKFLRGVYIGESARRIRQLGRAPWMKYRGVRDSVIHV